MVKLHVDASDLCFLGQALTRLFLLWRLCFVSFLCYLEVFDKANIKRFPHFLGYQCIKPCIFILTRRYFFIAFRERGRERERNINTREKHLERESNLQPFGYRMMLQPMKLHQSEQTLFNLSNCSQETEDISL